MISVPLAMAGGLLVVAIRQTLNIFSQIGMITLIGLVTKNGILIVEFANQNANKDLQNLKQLLKLLHFDSSNINDKFCYHFRCLAYCFKFRLSRYPRMSLGIVIVGGLLFSLILTLFVIPAIYIYFGTCIEKRFNSMKALYYTVILIACSVQGIYAQHSVSVQQAIDNTLANNYNIRIAKESAQQASIANSYTMTGALPNVQISGNLLPVDFSNSTAFSSESQHMVQVSIPLFNGLHVISSKQQLEALQQQGEIALTITIQNAIALVLQHYYDLVRQQYYTSILETSLDVAQERLHIVTTRQSVGLGKRCRCIASVYRPKINRTKYIATKNNNCTI